MAPLSATSLLTTWEAGLAQSSARRALLLLAAAENVESSGELERLPVGERDARLLALRESAFGPRLECIVGCPACGETLELAMSLSDLYATARKEGAELPAVARDGYEVRFRLPTSADLLALETAPDEAAGRRLLLERCVLEAQRQASPAAFEELPADVLGEVVAAMDRADPRANVELALHCPECGHEWLSAFDVVSYLWKEIDGWARRTLEDVHSLASAYGWSEREILAMSASRRHIYLDLVRQ